MIRFTNMRNLLTALILPLFFGGCTSNHIRTSAFELDLDGDWTSDSDTADREEYSYYSKNLDVHITVSFMLMKAKPEDTEIIANRLKTIRVAAERDVTSEDGAQATIVEPVVLPFPRGHQIAYHGHDSENREFRYLGFVLPDKNINLYAESVTRTEDELEQVFNDLLRRLTF